MGLGLYFETGEGPRFRHPIRSGESIARLPAIDIHRDLPYVIDAVRVVTHELAGEVPLIGFSGSPWTLATYMVEGGSSRDFARIKTMAYQQPEMLEELLSKLSVAVTDYLQAQIDAGVHAVQIFDTWGGALSDNAYRQFSLAFMHQIVTSLQKRNGRSVPIILFTKGGGQWLESIADTGCDAVGLDWTVDIGAARSRIGDRLALQGNMDPAVLRASPARIRDEVARVLASYGSGPGQVFNLGHGITPDIDPANVSALVDAVQELSPDYHAQSF